jgi:hypothetical protein
MLETAFPIREFAIGVVYLHSRSFVRGRNTKEYLDDTLSIITRGCLVNANCTLVGLILIMGLRILRIQEAQPENAEPLAL